MRSGHCKQRCWRQRRSRLRHLRGGVLEPRGGALVHPLPRGHLLHNSGRHQQLRVLALPALDILLCAGRRLGFAMLRLSRGHRQRNCGVGLIRGLYEPQRGAQRECERFCRKLTQR